VVEAVRKARRHSFGGMGEMGTLKGEEVIVDTHGEAEEVEFGMQTAERVGYRRKAFAKRS